MKKVLIYILFIFILLSALLIYRTPLLNDDAALYALAAKNAIVHNQWLAQFVTPGDPSSFLDKPPLGIWLLAWIPKITGVNQLTIHIPNLLYYALLLLILYKFVNYFTNKKLALYSTLITSTSLVLVVYSRTPKLDVLLTLFVLLTQFFIYDYLKNNKIKPLYWASIAIALGFLVKTGFALILPGLTVLALMIFNRQARESFRKVLFSKHLWFCLLLVLAIIVPILTLQSLALKSQFLPYLKSITIQSKYNTSYLGLVFNYPIIGLLLITIFPWSTLALSSLKLKIKKLNLHNYCLFWFWSNFLFLLFFFRQTDLRTFVVLVPPLAIIAAYKLMALGFYKRTRKAVINWNIFFIIVFTLILILLKQPAANLPLLLFIISLIAFTIHAFKPSDFKLTAIFALVCLAYIALFYNTLPLAQKFNDDFHWPGMVKEYQAKDYKFVIYRPQDRQLIMSPDLFYVDFLAGPADQYVWQPENIVNQKQAIILSDTKSLAKLNLKPKKLLARDGYSSLILR